MRPVLVSALMLSCLAACGLPPSTPMTTGTAAYDRSTGEFWISGQPYILPPSARPWGLRSGDRVTAYYRQEGEDRIVTRVEVEERPPLFHR